MAVEAVDLRCGVQADPFELGARRRPVTTLCGVVELPDNCNGTATSLLAPGGFARATLKVNFTAPGAYEYLSTGGGPSGDASSGMKGVLNVT